MNLVELLNQNTTCDSLTVVIVHILCDDFKKALPLQVLTKSLRPVLRQHFVHVIFLQPAFVSNAEQRIEPPE